MEQRLYTEQRLLFETTKESPIVIRIIIRMRDLIDPDALRYAVDMTMKRYPYFCVELQKRDGHYVFVENRRPVVIADSMHGAALNSAESHYHMIAFCRQDNRIVLDVFHGMTDGTGAYEVVRTLLYYYCSERYKVKLSGEGIRLVGDEIPAEEWIDPVIDRTDLPFPEQNERLSDALDLVTAAGLEEDRRQTVYSVAISEDAFMRFNLQHDGSPGTMVALLLSRAISKLFPQAEDVIRVALCVNQRTALRAPLAHQCLVGGALLEYKGKLRDWPLEMQGTAYRGMVFAQTREDKVLMDVASSKQINDMFLSKESDTERLEVAAAIRSMAVRVLTATVSYVGKANYREAERYIRDFRLWTSTAGEGLLVEISAVNGRFTLDFLQKFSSPIIVNAFLKELEENGIEYDLQDVNALELPSVRLPWTE